MPEEELTPERKRLRESIARKLGGGSITPPRKPKQGQRKQLQQENPKEELVVVARNPAEMQAAQQTLIDWAGSKMEECLQEKAQAEEDLALAESSKWRTSGWKRVVSMVVKRYEYYEKIKAALEAGFVIVPNFDLDIFAIRTKKTEPTARVKKSTNEWSLSPDQMKQASERPKLGAGEYVSDEPKVETTSWTETRGDKEVTRHEGWPCAFQAVDFPFKLVQPRILDATAKAMARKVFDEIGVIPNRRRRADPMVVGQIVHKTGGYSERRVSFLITWWLRELDLIV